MRKVILAVLMTILSVAAIAQVKGKAPVAKKPATTAPAKKTLLDSASYAFGMSVGNSLKLTGINTLNYDMLVKGLKDMLAETPTMLSREQAQISIQAYIGEATKKRFAKNLEEGKAFLAKNKTQPGVKTTASGLQYLVLQQGTGEKPLATDTIVANYRGTLINGIEFDASEKHGAPLTRHLNGVIQGWTEAFQLMPVGSKYRLFIPYDLAYGEIGAGDDIPPYSTLIFDVELLDIKRKK